MHKPEHDADVAERDIDGDVTANNQDGQTEQEILDKANAKGYKATFSETITVEACNRDEAFIKARNYWDALRKLTSTEVDITVVEAD